MTYQFNEAQTKWIAALRSEEFLQGVQYLTLGDSYCCLGVACEIFAKDLALTIVDEDEAGISYNGLTEEVPTEIVELLKLNGNVGQSSESEKYASTSLAFLNDGGATFAEIADLLESTPEEYFR